MNLGEMKQRAFWVLERFMDPTEVLEAELTQILNDGIKDISPVLNIVKSATLTFTNGVASLPSDFISPIAVYDGDILLFELRDIKRKVADDATTSQFYIPNNKEIYIYGKTPAGTVTEWYKAYETALSSDNDTPANIPVQFHYALPEIYVKAKYYLKINQLVEYADFMSQWERVKKQVYSAVHSGRLANSNQIEDVYGSFSM